MYKYVLNLVIKISLMFAQYFEYYAIILRGAVFLWTQCICMYPHCTVRIGLLYAFNKCFDFDFEQMMDEQHQMSADVILILGL